ncbi:sensor histidine kinase [Paraburkholderia sp. BCC1886]|uniref:sensor histidine kinase n=1 Tax=Paraburkholderia sp. BCC1886 TaxID=2562670 RepID=UPI001642BF92|nr:HAMP domain-containing sensor histidine kinase [Paraburkholderia sp. BCC1886]
MLHNFLTNNRAELIARCQERVSVRLARDASADQLENGIPKLIDQLIHVLKFEQSGRPKDALRVSGSAGGDSLFSELGVSAALHGRDLIRLGYTIDEVVHDYGDLCQTLTDLAHERDAPFTVEEYRTFNRCLDNAIADAVKEFSYQRDFNVAGEFSAEENERRGLFAHELRDHLNVAKLAFAAIKAGGLPVLGATGTVLERALGRLEKVIDSSIDDVRPPGPRSGKWQVFSVADFIGEVAYAADLAAQVRGCKLIVPAVDATLAIHGDRDLLYSAVGNLLQNAFKFTRPNTEVSLTAYAASDRILIDVADHGGGLAPGMAEQMFQPFTQFGTDRSGLGLGLSIARRSVELNDGVLSVRVVLNVGCIFTISLPRHGVVSK